jgi:phenylalanyl-tRNA synthetase beta chain
LLLLLQANVVLDTVVAMFSELCAEPFTAEPVNIHYEATNEHDTTPKLSTRQETACLKRLAGILGVELEPEAICKLCAKMQLGPAVHDAASNSICVTVPPTRSDVLHAIDIMEDVAIAYGYNALPLKLPSAYTVGRPDPLNAFSDLLREEVARAGYTELLTHGLCDRVEVEGHLRVAPGSVSCVTLSEADYEVVRTTLLPGVLKTLQHNRGMSVKEGVRMFEVSVLLVQCLYQQ